MWGCADTLGAAFALSPVRGQPSVFESERVMEKRSSGSASGLPMSWNWNSTNDADPHRRPLQVLELLEEHWRVVAPTGRVLTCASYRVDGPGVEVRAGCSPDDVQRSERVSDATHARVVAEMWRASLLAQGLTELPVRKVTGRRS
jgi:hypothetical protein